MTLRMADGPVANLPPGMDAYGGYVNDSGIGETWPGVEALAAQQHAVAFSFTTNGSSAQCADVEKGAMSSWAGYSWGYCAVSNVYTLIAQFGRPYKLLTAHRDPKFGKHICGPKTCNYGGNLATTADGTQWSNHGGTWDESVLADDFFDLAPPPAPPVPAPAPTTEDDEMADGNIVVKELGNQRHVFVSEVTDAVPPVVSVHHWTQAINGVPSFGWTYEKLGPQT